MIGQPQFQIDPRQAGRLRMAQALMQQSMDTSPVRHWTQGAARMGQALVGGLTARRAEEESENRRKEYAATMAQALQAAQGSPAGLDPKTGITWDTARQGDPNAMAQILAGNPDTAPVGIQMALQRMAAQQQLQDALTRTKAEKQLAIEYDPQLEAAKKKAVVPVDLAAKEGEFKLKAQYEPSIAGATEAAKNVPLAARAGMEAQARLPAQQALATTNAELDVAKAGPVAQAQAAAQAGGKEFDRANTLRDEFNNLTKDFRTVQDAYNKIKKAAPTGAGDMSLLYSYVKLLDPGSVVRESEFGVAAASGSFGERIQGLAQRIISGQRLPDSLRKDFLREADSIYQGQKRGYDTAKQTYSDLAGKYNIAADKVIVDYAAANAPAEAPPPASPPATPPGPAIAEGATATNPQTGQKVIFKGGQWVPM
jgi:hypothetical protein